jgi:hypothetical protein
MQMMQCNLTIDAIVYYNFQLKHFDIYLITQLSDLLIINLPTKFYIRLSIHYIFLSFHEYCKLILHP